MMSIEKSMVVSFPRISDLRGSLTFIESGRPIPFQIKRTYWIYDVPGGEMRGGHAYQNLQECFIALSGSFDVILDDGIGRKTVSLNRSYRGLYVPNQVWRRLDNFSTNAVCLILASDYYDANDYIRDYGQFLKEITKRGQHEQG